MKFHSLLYQINSIFQNPHSHLSLSVIYDPTRLKKQERVTTMKMTTSHRRHGVMRGKEEDEGRG